MSAPAEERETLQAEVLVPLKRRGSDRVHFALVMPATVTPGSHWGSPCDFVAAPVVALCGATLWGQLVVIQQANVAEWRSARKVCAFCTHVMRAALATHPDRLNAEPAPD